MSQPFNSSTEIAKLAAALAGFQSEDITIIKDSTNPHFKNRFASLDAIWTAIRPFLKKYGLAVTQLPLEGGKLLTVVLHQSGEWISTVADLYAQETPQGQGSGITYLRRYSLCAALGLVTEEDDDGNAAQPTAPTAARYIKVPPKAQSVPTINDENIPF